MNNSVKRTLFVIEVELYIHTGLLLNKGSDKITNN